MAVATATFSFRHDVGKQALFRGKDSCNSGGGRRFYIVLSIQSRNR